MSEWVRQHNELKNLDALYAAGKLSAPQLERLKQLRTSVNQLPHDYVRQTESGNVFMFDGRDVQVDPREVPPLLAGAIPHNDAEYRVYEAELKKLKEFAVQCWLKNGGNPQDIDRTANVDLQRFIPIESGGYWSPPKPRTSPPKTPFGYDVNKWEVEHLLTQCRHWREVLAHAAATGNRHQVRRATTSLQALMARLRTLTEEQEQALIEQANEPMEKPGRKFRIDED